MAVLQKFERYLKLRNFKSNYIRGTVNRVDASLKWLKKNKNIKSYRDITRDHVEDYIYYLKEEHKSERTGEKLGIDYINLCIVAIGKFSEWLKETDRIKKDFKIRTLRGTTNYNEKPPKYITEEELGDLYSHITESRYPHRNKFFILCMGQRGMRVGEALALDLEDIDIKRSKKYPYGFISITKTLGYHKIEDSPKTQKGKRENSMSKDMRWEYTQYLKEERTKLLKGKDSKAVFISEDGNRWSRHTVRHYFDGLNRKLKFRHKLTPHVLRHTFITITGSKGASDHLLMDIVGQKDLKAFKRYRHVMDVERSKIMDLEPKPNGEG